MSNALGTFLRARRAALSPADVGLPRGTRRRTPGLRREELAALAGVSVDYYTRLEQGRETGPSPQVLRALATALQMDAESAAHLDALARPPLAAPEAREGVPDTVVRLVETVRPNPAYVLNRVADVLAVNPEGLRLMRGLDDWPRERWNSVRWIFTHPAAREVLADWAHSAADNVAHLRTQEPQAPDVAALVAELSEVTEFAELWRRYEVRAWNSRVKTFHHPEDGELRLVSQSLTLPGGGDRLVIYQPAED
ncbi:transcriptional regulator [Actinorhabdospora filicis]|uniref:Transcriptional regulator n=1 Tax=Actinorhabdospora filicis TaxID=1785913 RepID=A0A9W6SSG0_9ACTN|nr:helix-turn-helix transcriptional regulator [Actinorhabdospora filicis]GLZ81238.1 transcriptional regulator [Actinorhabdospora filicis]